VSFDPSRFIVEIDKSVQKEEIEYQILNSFSGFAVSETLKKNILAKGYDVPTPIQDQVIPSILEGRDVIGVANTGTGKTAAFLIPLIEKVVTDKRNKVLIIAPTRELALQINNELFAFTKGLYIRSVLCIGGANIRRQTEELRRNPNFVIGTPGRILDLATTSRLRLNDFSSVVLDETDRMVDIGFLQDIRRIISLLPVNRQSLCFSATVDGKVKEVLLTFLKNPVFVSVKKTESAANVDQKIVKISDSSQKIEELHKILITKECRKTLVFGRTKHSVQRLSNELNERGFRSEAIHGNKNQSQRIRALEKFKRDEVYILVATDVASRGLDIPDVTHVINFDLPESRDAYIHRIGRTGRADKKGTAITFV
jgi:superfamily II DNA/RNA helicase